MNFRDAALEVAGQTDKYWRDRETSKKCGICGQQIRASSIDIAALTRMITIAMEAAYKVGLEDGRADERSRNQTHPQGMP